MVIIPCLPAFLNAYCDLSGTVLGRRSVRMRFLPRVKLHSSVRETIGGEGRGGRGAAVSGGPHVVTDARR